MEDAVDLVRSLSNVQAVSLLKRVNQDLYGALPYAEVERSAHKEMRAVLAVDSRARKQSMDPESSVETARMLLAALARDPDLAPLVVQSWEAIRKDHTLLVEAVLAVGLVLNVTLFMSTTEMEFKVGKLKIRKKAADAKILKELMVPVTALVKKFAPGS